MDFVSSCVPAVHLENLSSDVEQGRVVLSGGVTRDRKCSRCHQGVFTGGHDAVTVMCPKGHRNVVKITGTREQKDQWVNSFKCPQDGLQCRLDTAVKKA